MKKCPFCAEEIQDEAIKCRYCNEIIVGNPFLMKKEEQPVRPKSQWYCSWWFIGSIMGLYMPWSFFLSIPLIWINRRWSRNVKITWTIIFLVLAGMTWYVEIKFIKPYLNKMGEEYAPIINLYFPNMKT